MEGNTTNNTKMAKYEVSTKFLKDYELSNEDKIRFFDFFMANLRSETSTGVSVIYDSFLKAQMDIERNGFTNPVTQATK